MAPRTATATLELVDFAFSLTGDGAHGRISTGPVAAAVNLDEETPPMAATEHDYVFISCRTNDHSQTNFPRTSTVLPQTHTPFFLPHPAT
jgi:hypothetical protein